MSIFCNKGYFMLLSIMGFNLFISSCSSKYNTKKQASLNKEAHIDKQKKPTEEEIKYFFPRGRYDIYISYLDDFAELDDGSINPNDIKGMNIVDPKGNPVDADSIFETVEIEGRLRFKSIINIEEHELIEEFYGPGYVAKSYCTKIYPRFALKNLIFDDNLVVRLYDKNNKIISENTMINDFVYPIEEYLKDRSAVQHKIKPYGSTETELIGMLELPPKGQREGLKYRALRIDDKGNPKPYLWEFGRPYQDYLWEGALDPYSEYKNWEYNEKADCYTKPSTYRGGPDQIVARESD